MKQLNVGMIGYQFMGKAHSNAWLKTPLFFDAKYKPVLKAVCGRHKEPLQAFADRWGWQEVETDWRKIIERDDIDIIDIVAPTYLHHDIVIQAAQAGKHIFCEKPLALNFKQAQEMYQAVKDAGIIHYLNHNYRKCPAILLAKQLIDQGKLGTIFHWKGEYLQDWIVDPNFPLTWHLKKETAGSGSHNDLNSHSVDLARFLVGDIKSVTAMTTNFVKERPLPDDTGEGAFNSKTQRQETGEVTVDDASFMLTEFANGALGSFQASRFALGRKNYNRFEIYGSKGSIVFNLERMNELQYFSKEDPKFCQGFRTILATESCHPYISSWWPPGHIIGYEHEFVHSTYEFLNAIAQNKLPEPNIYDGLKVMQILDAGLESAKIGQKINIEPII